MNATATTMMPHTTRNTIKRRLSFMPGIIPDALQARQSRYNGR